MSDTGADQAAWTIYALGGGMGHLTRAISLARQAARNGDRVRILSNSPFLSLLMNDRVKPFIDLGSLIDFISLSHRLEPGQLAEVIRREVTGCSVHDVLVVDSFPRGICGELVSVLPDIRALKVFIHRDLNPQYVQQFDLAKSLMSYDLVLVPGEEAPLEHLANARTATWMVCDADEMQSRTTARAYFGLVTGEQMPLVVVVGSGTARESRQAAELARVLEQRLARQALVRFSSLDDAALKVAGEIGMSPWPLLTLLSGVDLLVGAGGYHTVYESRVTETPLLGIPQERLYDRQARRLGLENIVTSSDELVARITSVVRSPERKPCDWRARFPNGAAEAFRIIAGRILRQRRV